MVKDTFIEFLIASGVLTFGDFITKSGRNTPYFLNTGNLNTGDKISKLGSFYAEHITDAFTEEPNIIFGPAYKGIPLAISTSEQLSQKLNIEIYYSFDRKEIKAHGDKGTYVGRTPQKGDKIIIVEDVVTAGTTLQSIVPQLREIKGIELLGVVIAVDRREVGRANDAAVDELSKELAIKIAPLITIHDIIAYIEHTKNFNEYLPAIKKYLEQYGA